MRAIRIFSVAILCYLCIALAHGKELDACESDEDCPGYNGNTFCSHASCQKDGTCAHIPSPCSSSCLEEEKRCVECTRDEDCADSTGLCSQETNTCEKCTRDTDCPQVSWCLGGQQICSSEGHCLNPPPKNRPCADADACIAEWRQCGACAKHADCAGGDGDFCARRATCDSATGQCLARERPCTGKQSICNATTEACMECSTDADCISDDDPYCQTMPRCDAESGECVAGEPVVFCGTSNDYGGIDPFPLARCVERERACKSVLCDTDADCDDGDSANGVEWCDNSTCVRSRAGSEYEQHHGDSFVNASVLGMPCEMIGAEDPTCRKGGYVCKVVGVEQTSRPDPATLYDCERCLADAECVHTNMTSGRQTYVPCEFETGRCMWEHVPLHQRLLDDEDDDTVGAQDIGYGVLNLNHINAHWAPFGLQHICNFGPNFTFPNASQCLHNISLMFNFTTNATVPCNAFVSDDRLNAVIVFLCILAVIVAFGLLGALIRYSSASKKTKRM